MFLFFIVFVIFYSSAQQKDLSNFIVSNIDNKVQQQYQIELGKIGNNYFTVHEKISGTWDLKYLYSIVTYDESLKVINSNVLALKVGKNFTKYYCLQNIDEHLYLFSSYASNKTHTNSFYVREFDPKTLDPIGKEKKIASIPYAKGGRKNSGSFSVSISPDRSKIMIYKKYPWNREDTMKYGVVVYDSKLNKLWEIEQTVPHAYKKYRLQNKLVDNNGNAYIIGWYRKENMKGYDLISITNSGAETKTHKMNTPAEYVSTITCQAKDDNTLVFAGYTASDVKYKETGFYYHQFDTKTQKVIKSNHSLFNEHRILNPITLKKKNQFIENDKTGYYDYLLDHSKTLFKKDGGAYIINESYYEYTLDGKGPDGSSQSDSTYEYDHITILNIDSDGKVIWGRRLQKNQKTKNDGATYSSYIGAIIGNDLIILYNDHEKNLNRDPDKKLKKFKGSKSKGAVAILKHTLTSDGNILTDTVINDEDAKTYIDISPFLLDKETELLLFTQKWGLLEKYKKYTLTKLK